MAIRITLADGHAVVRAGLSALLSAEPDMQLVDAVSNGAALGNAATTQPDVVVMDVLLPEPEDGIAAIQALRTQSVPPRVLVLTACETPVVMQMTLVAGAVGYVLKQSALPTLLAGIRAVADGRSYLDSAITDTVAQTLRGQHVGAVPPLSEREERVLASLARGQTMKEIAHQLGLSVKTIETYRQRGVAKLGLESRVALMRYAVTQGWLSVRR